METTRTPLCSCPKCGHAVDAATTSETGSPSPGDLTVCLHCAYPLVFNDDLTVRKLSLEDVKAMSFEEAKELRFYITVAENMIREKKVPS